MHRPTDFPNLPANMNPPRSSFLPSLRRCRTLGFVLILACTAVPAVRAGSVADLDRDGGLPGAPIGAPLSTFNGLKETENTGRWLTYTRPADRLEFLGIPIKGITYNFFKERLYSINIDVTGKHETRKLIKTLEERYGTDHSFDTRAYPKTRAEMEIREWKGTKLYCLYKSASDFEGGVLTLLDRPTWDQLQVPKQEKDAATRSLLNGSFTNGDF